MLLRSRPDTVRRFLLRKTQISTPLAKGSSINFAPRQNITLTIADCQYREPLTPRLPGVLILPFLTHPVKSNQFFIPHLPELFQRLSFCRSKLGLRLAFFFTQLSEEIRQIPATFLLKNPPFHFTLMIKLFHLQNI